MPKNLWELRIERGLTVKQLAGKSGVSASDIYAYEGSKPIRTADRARLAKVLYVDKYDIKVQSDPKPKQKKSKPKPAAPKPPAAKRPMAARPSASPAPSKPQTTPPKPAAKKKQPSSKPARESQITHLLQLANKMGQTETAVVKTIGKPLTELTQQEAGRWLLQYTEELKALKAKRAAESESERPPNTRRRRFHLPESVDVFEFNYLTARQEAGDLIAFKLFDGTELNGRIIGFSSYTITIVQPDGAETTIQKLALAYYAVAQATEVAT
ncbi:MAG: helix-turn-helix transcriptional regulator [Chloroflexi bacterium]|nr:helix-turn-helix transcriptional regulator [Chloroflexota bacterium]